MELFFGWPLLYPLWSLRTVISAKAASDLPSPPRPRHEPRRRQAAQHPQPDPEASDLHPVARPEVRRRPEPKQHLLTSRGSGLGAWVDGHIQPRRHAQTPVANSAGRFVYCICFV